MLLTELETDRAPEVHQLRVAEAVVQPGPELVAGAIRVVRDRVGPFESGTRGVVEAGELQHLGVVRQVPVAELLYALIGDASLDHVLAYVAPARERIRHQRADLIGGRAQAPH